MLLTVYKVNFEVENTNSRELEKKKKKVNKHIN